MVGCINLDDLEVETPRDRGASASSARCRTSRPRTVILAPDCGMKYLPRESAIGKLRAMVEGGEDPARSRCASLQDASVAMREFVYRNPLARPHRVRRRRAARSAARSWTALGIERALVLRPRAARARRGVVAALSARAAPACLRGGDAHAGRVTAPLAAGEARQLDADGVDRDRRRLDDRSRQGARARIRTCRIVAVPTTYAGSEVTLGLGVTDDGVEEDRGRDPRVLPRTVIYDPELSLGLPFAVTVVSLLNAIAHAAEALYARSGNPVMDLLMPKRASAAGAAALARARCASRATSTPVATHWSPPGCAAPVLGDDGDRPCTTSSATRSAAAFGCRMPKSHAVVLPHATRLQRAGGAARDGKDRARDCVLPACRKGARPRRRARPAPCSTSATSRCADVARGDRHARRKPRPRDRPRVAEPLSQSASARARGGPRVAPARVRRRPARLRSQRARRRSIANATRDQSVRQRRPSARTRRSRCAAPRSPRSA